MINKIFTAQPTTIQQKEDGRNNTGNFADTNSHHTKEIFRNGICAISSTNQVNNPEKTQEKVFSENPPGPDQSVVTAWEGVKRNPPNTTTLEVLPHRLLKETGRKRRVSAILRNDALQQEADRTPKDDQWLTFLRDFFKQTPISESSINKILSLQKKAREVEGIVFLIEDYSYSKGYGNLNLYIEFLRNFIRLSPGTLNLIHFSGCRKTLRHKLPNLLSGLPGHDMDNLIIHGNKNQRLLSPGTNKIFGIPYIIQSITPGKHSSKNILQIYTVWDRFSMGASSEAPLFQIANYRFFPRSVNDDAVQNKENHLPIYPYEVSRNTSTIELIRMEVANSLQAMNREILGCDTEKLTQFFTELLQSAKENKIYLALLYHAKGMTEYEYYNYTTAAKEIFSDKPIILIAPINEKRYMSEKGRKELINVGKVRFSADYSFDFTTEKSHKDNVTVFEFKFLPKRLFELVCYFSNIPIFAPGASTANIAQCFNKPYLGSFGHQMPTISNQEVSGRWDVVNDALYFNSLRMQKAKSALLTMSKKQIKLSGGDNRKCWSNPENAHLKLEIIHDAVTFRVLKCRGLTSTLLPHFFNGTDTSKIYKYPSISTDDRKSYFTRLIDESRLPDFCQYVCDQSNKIMLDYMSQATKLGGTFYELARELQQKALHPDNNMMLEVLERNLPNHSNPSKSTASASS